jgi:mono/diheme cytochrome c family protein
MIVATAALSWVPTCMAFGKETFTDRKEEKRWYTKQLRAFLGELDRSVSDRLAGPADQKLQAAFESLAERQQVIRQKLNQYFRKDFDQAWEKYRKVWAQTAKQPATPERDQALYSGFQQLRDTTYRLFQVKTTPSQNPERAVGALVYRRHCAACHGRQGDGQGVLARNSHMPMVPAPTDFQSLNALGVRNAFSYYNTLLAGIEDSTMPAFASTLSNHELWSVAFYLFTPPFRPQGSDALEPQNLTELKLDLSWLSIQSDRDIRHQWRNQSQQVEPGLDWLRRQGSFSSKIPREY